MRLTLACLTKPYCQLHDINISTLSRDQQPGQAGGLSTVPIGIGATAAQGEQQALVWHGPQLQQKGTSRGASIELSQVRIRGRLERLGCKRQGREGRADRCSASTQAHDERRPLRGPGYRELLVGGSEAGICSTLMDMSSEAVSRALPSWEKSTDRTTSVWALNTCDPGAPMGHIGTRPGAYGATLCSKAVSWQQVQQGSNRSQVFAEGGGGWGRGG